MFRRLRDGEAARVAASSSEVERWLSHEFPECPITAREIRIRACPAPPPRQRLATAAYRAAFKPGPSLQHGYLKWFAFAWLSDSRCISWDSIAVNWSGGHTHYEAGVYMPGYWFGRKWGRSWYGQVMHPNWEGPVGEEDLFTLADVASWGDTVVECGDTYPKNLVAPLQTFAVRRAVWLPYQFSDKRAEWLDFGHLCRAFSITRREPAHLRAHRLAKVRHAG